MSKRRKDLGSEDSFSDDFSPDKVTSKKSSKKKSKTFKSSDDEISESRVESAMPRRRAAKESAFDRQLRLAMEQSLREATENQNVDRVPKEKSEDPNVCPLPEPEKISKVSLKKLSSEEFPQLDWNVKESETEIQKIIPRKDSFDKTAEVADEHAKDSKILDEIKLTNNSDIIDLASPKNKINNSAEKPKKPKKPTKVLDSSDENGFGDIVSPKEKASNSAVKPKKSKKPAKTLESSEEEYGIGEKGNESSDEDYGSAKKKGSARKKTPPKKKKEPTKKKKSILDLNSPLEILEQENKTMTSSDSAKESAKKRRSILDLKSPLEILEPENKTMTPAKKMNASKKLDLKESPPGETSAKTKEQLESQISPDKENLGPKETNDSTAKKLLNMSDKYHEFNNQTLQKIEVPKTETHGLFPKYVSKLPSGITASTSTKSTLGSEESKQPVNPAFKSVATTAKLGNAAPIKNHSPAVRVGLSRNHRFPSLHKNVKPLL